MSQDESRLPARLFFGYLVATGLGSGYMRPAPGSWGSAAALLIAVVALPVIGPAGLLGAVAAGFLIGLPAVRIVEAHEEAHDPPHVVVDEFCGQWLAYWIVLWIAERGGFAGLDAINAAIAAFVSFRLFDIAKPWPVSLLERRKGAVFTLLDDMLAGALAGLAVGVLAHLARLVLA